MIISDVLARFREICPPTNVDELTPNQVKKDCKIAFDIIGYHPSNFKESFNTAWENSDAIRLPDFVFDVFIIDKFPMEELNES